MNYNTDVRGYTFQLRQEKANTRVYWLKSQDMVRNIDTNVCGRKGMVMRKKAIKNNLRELVGILDKFIIKSCAT